MSHDAALPPDDSRLQRLTDRLCAQQRTGWLAGRRIPVEEFLKRHPELTQRDELVFELLYGEILVQEELGETIDLGEYRRRFPRLSDQLARQMDIHRALQEISGWSQETALLSADSAQSSSLQSLRSGRPPEAPFLGNERFSILRYLGSGGMGSVYAAYDEAWEQRVALKILHAADSSGVLQLKQEFRALADLSHPHLVQLYELFTETEQPFFTMELVEGTNFVDFCRRDEGGRPDADGRRTGPQDGPLRDAFAQLAQGLCALHRAGKLHCDLKPSNVLVHADGRVVLLDFGMVQHQSQGALDSWASYLRGTIAYAAPELLEGHRPSEASDWYSVGAILYVALTDRVPFPGDLHEVLSAKAEFNLPAPAELAEDVPDDLNSLCCQLLSRRPEERPSREQILDCLGTPSQGAETSWTVSAVPELLFGRSGELRRLHEAFGRAAKGKTVKLLLRGTSGVGKSALLQHFLHELQRRSDVLVLAGQCFEQEAVPFKVLDPLIDGLQQVLRKLAPGEVEPLISAGIADLVRLFPVLDRVPEIRDAAAEASTLPYQQESRRRAIACLRELLHRLGRSRPVVLAMDDLQWGDPDSAVLLDNLLGSAGNSRLLFLACHRDESAQGDSFLTHLQKDASQHQLQHQLQHESQHESQPDFWTEEIAVRPLDFTVARELAESQFARDGQPAPDGWAETVVRVSDGNPFLILQLSSLPLDVLPAARRTAALDREQIDALLWNHVNRLPEPARQLLEVLVVAGHPLKPVDSCRAARLQNVDYQRLLRMLESGRFIRTLLDAEREKRIRPYHDRLRDSLLRQFSDELKRRTHLHLAAALEEADAPANAEHLVQHYAAAGRPAKTWTYARMSAALAAEQLAFEKAASQCRVALETGQGTAEERREVRCNLAAALANSGHRLEAAHLYSALAEEAAGAEARRLRRLATEQFLWTGYFRDPWDALGAFLKELNIRLPRTRVGLLFRAWRWELQIRWHGLEFEERRAEDVHPEQLEAIDNIGAAARFGAAYNYLFGFVLQKQHLLLALQAGEPWRAYFAILYEAVFLAGGGPTAVRRSQQLMARCEQELEERKSLNLNAELLNARGLLALLQGWWSDAAQFNQQANIRYREKQIQSPEQDATVHYLIWSCFFLGRFAAMADFHHRSLREARQQGNRMMSHWLGMSYPNAVWLIADDPERARAEIDQALEDCPPQLYSLDQFFAQVAEMHLHLYRGEPQAAWDYLPAAWKQVRRSGVLRMPMMNTQMLYFRGIVTAWAVSAGVARKPKLRQARRDARTIARIPLKMNPALAALLEAQIDAAEQNGDGAIERYQQAAAQFETRSMRFHAAAANARCGQLLGGDAGRSLVEASRHYLRDEKVKNPEQFLNLAAPVRSGRKID